jgi:hypothetical protein
MCELTKQSLLPRASNQNQTTEDNMKYTKAFAFLLAVAATTAFSYGTTLPSVPGTVVTDWVGNTFALRPPIGSANGDTTQYTSGSMVPDYVDAIWVKPNDGTVFTMAYYDENGRNGAIFRNGAMVGQTYFAKNQFTTGGDVVADNQFIYVTTQVNYGNWNISDFGIERFTLTGGLAGWHNTGSDTGVGVGNSFFLARTGQAPAFSKLALDSNAKELYLLDTVGGGTVYVWNLTTLDQNKKATFSVPGIQKMVSDNAGNLWTISAGQIKKFSNRGVYSGTAITSIKVPTCIAFNNGNLYVFDDSTLQVHVFNNLNTTPTEVTSKLLGVAGGIYSGIPGQVLPNKFLPSASGIGVDNAGNVYLAWGDIAPVAGTDIRSVTPSGTLNWEVLGQPFAGVPGFDPGTDGQTLYYPIYTDSIDYTKAPGKTWSYKSFTWNRFANPTAPSGFVGTPYGYTIVRNLGGQKFVFASVSSQTSGGFNIKRVDGQVLTPTVSVTDGNSFGWSVELGGNIWEAPGKLVRHRYGGLDASNSPIYKINDTFSVPVNSNSAAQIGGIQRIFYDSITDAMYLTGYSSQYPNSSGEWGRAGRVFAKYNGFLRGSRTLAWQDTLPLDNIPGGIAGSSLKDAWVEREYAFFVVCNSTPAQIVYVYKTSDGSFVGVITPDATIEGNISFNGTYGGLGWVDMVGGIQAYKRLNGEYEILVEDDVGNKDVFYHWCPGGAGTCNSSVVVVTPPVPTVPTISPNGATFVVAPQSVAVSATGSDSVQISYNNTTWTKYTAPLSLSTTATMYAKSFLGGVISATASASFTYAPVVVPPASPTIPSVTGLASVSSSGQTVLSWQFVNPITYNVYASSPGHADSLVGTTTNLSDTISGLVNGTAYTYHVTASDALGSFATSSTVVSTPLPPLPGIVAVPVAVAGNASVSLTWVALGNAASYQVYQNNGVKDSLVSITAATSYMATGLVNGTTYSFHVTAVNLAGQGPTSSVVTATPVLPVPAAAVVSDTTTSTATLTWAAASGATSYQVYMTKTGAAEVLVATTAATTFTVTLARGATYSFRVVAVNASGAGPTSASVTATAATP